MNKEEFDSKMSMLVTEKKLLEASLKVTKDDEAKIEIKKRIIYLRSEMQQLKNEYNKIEEKSI